MLTQFYDQNKIPNVIELKDECYKQYGSTFCIGDDNFNATVSQYGASLISLKFRQKEMTLNRDCLLYTSPSPRDATLSRMPSSA